MSDQAHNETDLILQRMEKRLTNEYALAAAELSGKLSDYLRKFQEKDRIKRRQLAEKKITQAAYNEWRVGQIMMGQRWEEMLATITEDLHNVNQIARSTINGYMPEVYALNHNYGTFQVETGALVDTSYTLYNREAVERMFREDPKLYPNPGKKVSEAIRAGAEDRWNRQKIKSVMTQSILQGDGIREIATRVAAATCDSNRKTAIRNARTMTTGIENAGREDAYKRAEEKGIKMKQAWVATLDNRTRHAHRILDGQTVPVGESFEVEGETIKYPGDPDAPAHLVYNCRCTMISQVEGFERDLSDLNLRRDEKLKGMSYDQWKKEKMKPEPITNPDDVAKIMAGRYARDYKR